ncbi:butyrophilin subfamily 1 member A1-like [Polymixia lowei]
MRSLTVGQSLGLMLLSSMCSSTCTSCVYYTTVISPVFIHFHRGEPQPTLALAGDDITLWYEPKPQTDFTDLTVEWSRADLKPRFVHLYHDRLELYESKNPAYKGRTTLAAEGLKRGNISLKLSRVRLSDQGNYTCFIPKLSKEADIQLIVGAVSQPVTSLLGMNQDRQGVVLGCQSKGWYPEPELSWLDSEGNVFPPGSTETVRSPDGTWNVNSTVTVKKTNTNRFTCRVHLQMFSRTREAEIHVPEVFFPEKQSSYALGIFVAAAVAVAIGLLLLVSCFIFFRRSGK